MTSPVPHKISKRCDFCNGELLRDRYPYTTELDEVSDRGTRYWKVPCSYCKNFTYVKQPPQEKTGYENAITGESYNTAAEARAAYLESGGLLFVEDLI